MKQLSISDLAREIGLRPSAIRYYEQIGLLLPAARIHGRRKYDSDVIARLAVIQQAQQTGFTLNEIRQLFFGFQIYVPPSKRWQKLTAQKLMELDELMDQIKTMKRLLHRLQNCRCQALDDCGKRMLHHQRRNTPKPLHCR